MAEITREAIAEMAETQGIVASNCGGAWHSAPDLARREHATWQRAAQILVGGARTAFEQLARAGGHDLSVPFTTSVQMWAMVTTEGGYSALHEHHGAGWSAVLYADAGDDQTETGGAIVFVDPRRVPTLTGGLPLFSSAFTVKPQTGMVVVFPGWLQHYTHPYQGTRERVCLSANITFSPR